MPVMQAVVMVWIPPWPLYAVSSPNRIAIAKDIIMFWLLISFLFV